jgi:hypothetical protein
MSTRQRLAPQKVIINQPMTADVFSLVTNVNEISMISYSIVWTGVPVGTFKVEVCNDYIPPAPGILVSDPNTGSWVPLALSSPIAAVGSADTAFIDIVLTSPAWIRLHYIFTSGTGNLNAVLAGKVS